MGDKHDLLGGILGAFLAIILGLAIVGCCDDPLRLLSTRHHPGGSRHQD